MAMFMRTSSRHVRTFSSIAWDALSLKEQQRGVLPAKLKNIIFDSVPSFEALTGLLLSSRTATKKEELEQHWCPLTKEQQPAVVQKIAAHFLTAPLPVAPPFLLSNDSLALPKERKSAEQQELFAKTNELYGQVASQTPHLLSLVHEEELESFLKTQKVAPEDISQMAMRLILNYSFGPNVLAEQEARALIMDFIENAPPSQDNEAIGDQLAQELFSYRKKSFIIQAASVPHSGELPIDEEMRRRELQARAGVIHRLYCEIAELMQ